MNAVTAWSYSRWKAWTECPLKFKLQFIDKMKEPKSTHQERGDRVHQALAKYITGHQTELPAEAESYRALLERLREINLMRSADVRTEQQWGFTKDWKETGWYAPDTWMRNILDVAIIYPDGDADVIDHKTGKKYGENLDQTELFALSVFCKFPQVQNVTARLWYVDSGDEVFGHYCRDDLHIRIAKWNERVEGLFADTQFLPKPNDKCKFCHWRKSNGGPCSYS